MLKARLPDLNATVWAAAGDLGKNPAAIADKIINDLFPRTMAEAESEGADHLLRRGLIDAIKPIIKGAGPEEEQRDFADIDPQFVDLVAPLRSRAYHVEALGEQVSVALLIQDRAMFEDARKFMRRKGEECIAEADRLDQLFAAVFGD